MNGEVTTVGKENSEAIVMIIIMMMLISIKDG